MFKATRLMFLSQVATTLLLFVRNVIVARLISVEDFGVAATFSILFTVIEILANLSVVKLIVQHPDGDSPRFQNTLHAVQVLRGILGAVLTIVLAYPYADFVNTPDLVWAYQCLAIIPVARAFFHLDTFRVQREMRFGPFAWNNMLSPLVGLAIIVPVWLIRPDYQVMLWSIIGQQVAAVILSHLMAERRFGLAWDMVHVRRALVFGMPLVLNGVVVIAVTNGERMIIANQLDLTVLGWFSVAFMLTTAGTRILMHTISNVFLPRLSRHQGDLPAFRDNAVLTLDCTFYVSGLMAVGLSLFGPALMIGMFGPDYAPGLAVLVILAAGQAVRVARVAPNTISMAQGHTIDLMVTGLVRLLALPVAYAALVWGYGVVMAVLIALLFEALALVCALALVRLRYGVPLRGMLPGFAAFCGVLGLVLADAQIYPAGADILGHAHALQLVLLAAGAGAVLAMPRLRHVGLGLLLALRRAP